MRDMMIGELAKAADVSAHTIRYYERRGLVVPDGRTESGYRRYRPDAVQRVGFIKKTQGLGFTLSEIGRLLDFDGSSEATTADVLGVTTRKIVQHRSKIADLERLHQALTRVAELCPGDDSPAADCPILHFFSAAEEPWK